MTKIESLSFNGRLFWRLLTNLGEEARKRDMAVLAFRLDRLNPVASARELGSVLDLEESPALVLEGASSERKALLIVDQLDTVSTMSGRAIKFFNAIHELLVEVRGLRQRMSLHVVIVCRTFDWKNDHRLRSVVTDCNAQVEIAEFSETKAKELLSATGFKIELLDPRQIDLLRLPQNLSLFLDAGFDPRQVPRFNTVKQLFDKYWTEKHRNVTSCVGHAPDQWSDVIQLLCEEMTRTQQLSVMCEILDPYEIYVFHMASEGVLTFDGQRYGFGHESFFDYCFARNFVRNSSPLADVLVTSEQHLFRRAQVRQVLAYLRDADRSRYCRELNDLLLDERIRIHIKELILSLVATVPDPSRSFH